MPATRSCTWILQSFPDRKRSRPLTCANTMSPTSATRIRRTTRKRRRLSNLSTSFSTRGRNLIRSSFASSRRYSSHRFSAGHFEKDFLEGGGPRLDTEDLDPLAGESGDGFRQFLPGNAGRHRTVALDPWRISGQRQQELRAAGHW